MDFKEQTIIQYVKQCQIDYAKGHAFYKEYVKKMQEKELDNFNEIDHVEMIIKPFLYKWGVMQRVLGRVEYRGWESDIVEQVRLNLENLEACRKMKFESSALSESKKNIIDSYESFNKIVNGVAAAKVLHIISPDFFPLWDNGILQIVGKEYARIAADNGDFLTGIGTSLKNLQDFSGANYFCFMKALQIILWKYRNTLFELANSYEKGVLKILDDFFWILVQAPLSIFL